MQTFCDIIKSKSNELNNTFNEIFTNNGAISFKSSLNPCVDLFYKITRYSTKNEIYELVNKSWDLNPLITLKIIAYIRDCRGGKGERKCGRILLKWLAMNYPDILKLNFIYFIEKYGRYDDLVILNNTLMEDFILEYIDNQLKKDLNNLKENKDVSLLAKWIPSENKKSNNGINMKIIKKMKLTPKTLRKIYLSPLRNKINIVETLMCKQKWNDINFNTVPSNAMHIYSKSFNKQIPEKYTKWENDLLNGKTKVNAEMLFPHQIVKKYYENNNKDINNLLEAQWKVMVEKCEFYPDIKNTLVLSDVSGSMCGLPMIISYTMGILISSLSNDILKNKILTFESNPQFYDIKGETLFEKIRSISKAPWGGSTNFIKAVTEILNLGRDNLLTDKEMPKRLIVVSDMQFNQASQNTNFEQIKKLYKEYDYTFPHIVFWNVADKIFETPVEYNDESVSIVSGFSIDILKSILSNEELPTPESTMLTAINDNRYNCLKI